MSLNASQIRQAYLDFFKAKKHVQIPRANLVPLEDPTTLFTGSGMQPLLPYLLGQEHPSGQRLIDSQPCFRAEDIDHVGDNRHTTFFEMLGNWSLGDYFKAEQLPWLFEFLTTAVKLDPTKLFVTVFAGDPSHRLDRDDESAGIWQDLFGQAGLEAKTVELGSVQTAAAKGMQNGRIFLYDTSKNWWSRVGPPEAMPEGEPGGPDSEVFYQFADVEHDPQFGQHCHPNCDCGRFIEIANSVFMQYLKTADGFRDLPKRNVDFGGGLERIAMAAIDSPDIFKIDLLWPIVQKVEELSGKKYDDHTADQRAIADHVRGVVFLAADGVAPSNNDQGYVMRRFMRRAIRRGHAIGIDKVLLAGTAPVVIDIYGADYPELKEQSEQIVQVLEREEQLFRQTLGRGVREFKKLAGDRLTGQAAFTLFDTYGFPSELSLEEAKTSDIAVDPDWKPEFDSLMAQQKERSRTAAAGMFKGGLADHSEITTNYHTATHLVYKALRQVLGDHVVQRGSNITADRLRFDFSHPQKMTPEEIKQVEDIVNQNIDRDWPMGFRDIPTDQALAEGALGAFGHKYGETVKVYTAGDPEGEWFSKEICGGPHVEHTGQLGEGGKRFKIIKEESSSAGVRRIKAVLK